MSKKRMSVRKRARDAQRKQWTISDPCLYCAQAGPHKVAFSHVSQFGATYKVSCCRCGKYQKFISEKMAKSVSNAQNA